MERVLKSSCFVWLVLTERKKKYSFHILELCILILEKFFVGIFIVGTDIFQTLLYITNDLISQMIFYEKKVKGVVKFEIFYYEN